MTSARCRPLALVRRWPVTLAMGAAYGASLLGAVTLDVALGPSLAVVFGVGLGGLVPLLAEHARPWPGRARVALTVGLGAAIWLGSAWALRAGAPWWLAHPANTAALLLAALALGGWIAAELEKPGHLIPVSVLGAGVDLWSSLAGPTAHIAQEASTHVQHTAAAVARGQAPPPPPWGALLIYVWPQPGAGGMADLVGFGDLVFLALFLAAARRFGLGLWRVGAALVVGLGAAVALAVGLGRPLPALPLLGAAFLAVTLPRLHLTRREWGITAGVLGGLLAGIGAALIR